MYNYFRKRGGDTHVSVAASRSQTLVSSYVLLLKNVETTGSAIDLGVS
jgi:hypothetical protein